MTQSKTHSLIESIANTAIGFIVSVVIQLFVDWWYNLDLSFGQNLSIVYIFTVASIARNYWTRRMFNNFHTRKIIKEN